MDYYQNPGMYNPGYYPQQNSYPYYPSNIGGYPYGYPPTPFVPEGKDPTWEPGKYDNLAARNMAANQMAANTAYYTPGAVSPIEMQDSNGNTVRTINTQYTPGGNSVNLGGYNPVNGMNNQPQAASGFNPYAQFIGNPEYGYTQPQQQYMPGTGYTQMPSFIGQPGFMQMQTPYSRGVGNLGYMTPYQQYAGYPMNSFDQQLQEILYNEQPIPAMDVKAMLEGIVLSDEEREKIDHRRNYNSIIGTDYYGRPIYSSNSYQANQERQNQFEEARHAYQKHFTMLSKIAHAYSGEEIDEEAVMKRFDPCPPQPQVKQFNWYNATDKEKKEYERDMRVQQTNELDYKFKMAEQNQAYLRQQKDYARAQIKASHDRMIGVEPGQHYDLKTFMDNGYKLGIDIAAKEAKAANRNGQAKYTQNSYRADLSYRSNRPVPVTSKDNEYVSIEEVLKRMYDRNKTDVSILKQQDGSTVYTSPGSDSPIETAHHEAFMRSVQQQKELNDIRKSME